MGDEDTNMSSVETSFSAFSSWSRRRRPCSAWKRELRVFPSGFARGRRRHRIGIGKKGIVLRVRSEEETSAVENDTDVARARETVVETWDDWRLDQEWDDDDDDATTTTTTTSFESTTRRDDDTFSFPTQKTPTTKNEEAAADDDDNKYLGYATKEDRCLIDFWREHFPSIKDFDVSTMMKLSKTHAKLRDAALVARIDRRVRALLPGVHVLNVLQRCPTILERLDFSKASRRILEIQDVLCSEEMCHDVVDIVEKTPDLLLCESVYEEREKTIEKLNRMCNRTDTYEGGAIAKGKTIDAERTVAEYPELLYRLKEYDSYYDLPVSILNTLSGPNEDEILDEDYDQMWEENARGASAASDEMSHEEWRHDGYWDPKEDDDEEEEEEEEEE